MFKLCPCEFSLVSFDIFLAFEFRFCKFAKFEFISFKFVSLFVVLNFATFSLKFYPKLNFSLAKNFLNSFLPVRDFSKKIRGRFCRKNLSHTKSK